MASVQPRSPVLPRRRLAIVVGAPLLAVALIAASPMAERAPPTTCVQSWPEVRYRNYAYDHIVHLTNACQARAMCAVSSDVNPTAVNVDLAVGESTEVLTARGSPAREFTPRVDCGLLL